MIRRVAVRYQKTAKRRLYSTQANKPNAAQSPRLVVPPRPSGQPRPSPANAPQYKEKLILRDFFADCLYKRTESYFSQHAPVIQLKEPFDFGKMWGVRQYQSELYKVFQDADGFMTPVEIFKPLYAEAVARYMIEMLKKSGLYNPQTGSVAFTPEHPFSLIEIGGGNGTCAVGVLDFIRDHHPALYEYTTYTIIDVSKPFVERQRQTLANHAHKVTLHNKSIFDFKLKDKNPGFVIALELLDNLPYDKLVTDNFGIIRESWVEIYPPNTVLPEDDRLVLPVKPLFSNVAHKITGGKLDDSLNIKVPEMEVMRERFKPVEDPILLEALEKVCEYNAFDADFLHEPKDKDRIKDLSSKFTRLWHFLQYPDTTRVDFEFEALQQALEERARGGVQITPEQLVLALNQAEEQSTKSDEAPPVKSISNSDLVKYWLRNFNRVLRPKFWKSLASNYYSQRGFVSANRIIFFPTMHYLLLKQTKELFPNKELIFADFDRIPGAMVGLNGPLIQRTEGNETTVFKSYLQAPRGYCDIFFPTDFDLLQVLYRQVYHEIHPGFSSTHVKSKVFLKKYANYQKARTRSGYNPLLQDFTNTRFFLTAGF